jgi:acyl-CoA thioester hydrolase
MQVRIYYHDTDSGGVVYYANYLKYMEEARTEFFTGMGISIKDLAERGTLFVVARQEIEYAAPAFYGDLLEVGTRFTSVQLVKMEVEHEIKNQAGALICKGKTTLVCVDKNIEPKAIPEEIKNKLKEATSKCTH